MPLLTRFLHDLRAFSLTEHLAGRPIVVAVSGGPDSVCLLHLLRRLALQLALDLRVATLDHGLRGADGAADAEFVVSLAQDWGLPAQRGYADVPALMRQHGLGTEAAARLARYTFLAETARQTNSRGIVTGHNADDQAETILLHLIRGSGLAGLRGMRPAAPLTPDHLLPGSPPPDGLTLLRPLLNIPRADIEAYCAEHRLPTRADATNTSPAYLRNRIRQEVLPLLTALNPSIRETLARTARVTADDFALIERLIEAAWEAMLVDASPDRVAFDRARFRTALDRAIQRGLLRRALEGLMPPGVESTLTPLDQALALARMGQTGRRASLPGGIELRIEPDRIAVQRAASAPHLPDWPWIPAGTLCAVPVPGTIRLPGTPWVLHTRWLAPGEDPVALRQQPRTATLAVPPGAALCLRTRQPGDRLEPLGMRGRNQKLSDLMINARVPTDQRDYLPVLADGPRIGWVGVGPQGRVADPWAVKSADESVVVVFWEEE